MAVQSTLRGSGGQKQKSTSNTSSGPSKKSKSGPSSRRASVLTEEEDEARLASEGVEFVEDEEEDGNITGHRAVNASAPESGKEADEDDEAELSMSFIRGIHLFTYIKNTERMWRQWNSAVYAFFEPVPSIDYIKGRKCHTFQCSAKGCKQTIRCYIGTADAQSTGNMRKHAKKCWGDEAMEAADSVKDVSEACKKVVKSILQDGSIMGAFERTGKGKVIYSHRQHTKAETK
jgi:hypothetical protein